MTHHKPIHNISRKVRCGHLTLQGRSDPGSLQITSPGPARCWSRPPVKDLVAGSDIEFVDRGEHQLRGLPNTWRLLAVADSALGAAPNRALLPLPHTL